MSPASIMLALALLAQSLQPSWPPKRQPPRVFPPSGAGPKFLPNSGMPPSQRASGQCSIPLVNAPGIRAVDPMPAPPARTLDPKMIAPAPAPPCPDWFAK